MHTTCFRRLYQPQKRKWLPKDKIVLADGMTKHSGTPTVTIDLCKPAFSKLKPSYRTSIPTVRLVQMDDQPMLATNISLTSSTNLSAENTGDGNRTFVWYIQTKSSLRSAPLKSERNNKNRTKKWHVQQPNVVATLTETTAVPSSRENLRIELGIPLKDKMWGELNRHCIHTNPLAVDK